MPEYICSSIKYSDVQCYGGHFTDFIYASRSHIYKTILTAK